MPRVSSPPDATQSGSRPGPSMAARVFLSREASVVFVLIVLCVMMSFSPARGQFFSERNVQQIGYLNIGMALHPTVLADGRIMFSSQEAQGIRTHIEWSLWHIRPDGTQWGPLLSGLLPGGGAPDAFHFQTQLLLQPIDGHA